MKSWGALSSRPCVLISSTIGSLRIIFTHELFRRAQHRAHQTKSRHHVDHHGTRTGVVDMPEVPRDEVINGNYILDSTMQIA